MNCLNSLLSLAHDLVQPRVSFKVGETYYVKVSAVNQIGAGKATMSFPVTITAAPASQIVSSLKVAGQEYSSNATNFVVQWEIQSGNDTNYIENIDYF